MHFYRLGIQPSEADGEGEDHAEWFGSLREAKQRRTELLQAFSDGDWSGHRTGEDFEIERIELVQLPLKRLILAILNRRGFIGKCQLMVARAHGPRLTGREGEDRWGW
jgi:hypothetical protein